MTHIIQLIPLKDTQPRPNKTPSPFYPARGLRTSAPHHCAMRVTGLPKLTESVEPTAAAATLYFICFLSKHFSLLQNI